MPKHRSSVLDDDDKRSDGQAHLLDKAATANLRLAKAAAHLVQRQVDVEIKAVN
jgi:hypothetical protein